MNVKRRDWLVAAPALGLALGSGRAVAGWLDLFNGARLGQRADLSTLRYTVQSPDPERRLTMLYFWATWCGPCKEDMPGLNALLAGRAAQGLGVIAVTSEPEAAVATFAAAVPIRVAVGLDEKRTLFKTFGIRAIPYAVLLDRRHEAIWVGQRGDLGDTQLDRLLTAASAPA